MIPAERLEFAPTDFASAVRDWLRHGGRRFGHLTARIDDAGRTVIEALLLDVEAGSVSVLSAPLDPGKFEYPSVTRHVAAAHRAERALGDYFGVRAVGHPKPKSLVLHDPVWPADFAPLAGASGLPREPYSFLKVAGEGIHEIPVGPIHAGIIEPGHFRFSCAGEIIAFLEIRLGYQHRGVEKRLAETPWPKARFLAESAASDTAVGNALAHSLAVESLLGVKVPPRAEALRTIALEIERLASHVGDLGALCGDIGFSAGASLFAPFRGAILGLGTILAGSRFMRYFVQPGGVARDIDEPSVEGLTTAVEAADKRLKELLPVVFDNQGIVERMEGTGRLSKTHCRDFGLVGPTARAGGVAYDVRAAFHTSDAAPVATRTDGDVLARAQVRADEALASITLIRERLANLQPGPVLLDCEETSLPPDAVGVGIVEAWRGELIHWITTRADGTVARYAVKDPSFNDWTGLSVAVRGNLVADFPLCNKSFNLSYSGHDL